MPGWKGGRSRGFGVFRGSRVRVVTSTGSHSRLPGRTTPGKRMKEKERKKRKEGRRERVEGRENAPKFCQVPQIEPRYNWEDKHDFCIVIQ